MIGPAGLQGLRAILALQRGRAQQLWATRGPTAISTKPPCTQLTPSGAERARRERRHPKASTTKSLPPLTPLENNICAFRPKTRVASGPTPGHLATANVLK